MTAFPPRAEQRCSNCRFAMDLPKRDDDVLRCARYAPQILGIDCRRSDDPFTVWGNWPATLPELWCGEWVAADLP